MNSNLFSKIMKQLIYKQDIFGHRCVEEVSLNYDYENGYSKILQMMKKLIYLK